MLSLGARDSSQRYRLLLGRVPSPEPAAATVQPSGADRLLARVLPAGPARRPRPVEAAVPAVSAVSATPAHRARGRMGGRRQLRRDCGQRLGRLGQRERLRSHLLRRSRAADRDLRFRLPIHLPRLLVELLGHLRSCEPTPNRGRRQGAFLYVRARMHDGAPRMACGASSTAVNSQLWRTGRCQ